MALLDDFLGLLTDPDFLKTILQTGSLVGGNVAATGAQTAGINAALQESGANREFALNLINTIRAEEAPFQEAALQRTKFGERFLPRIEASLSGVDIPGSPVAKTGETFNLLVDEGLDRFDRRAAVTGAPSGGGNQIAKGRFLAGASASEADRIDRLKQEFRNNLFRAGGIQGTPTNSQAPSLAPVAAGASNTSANLLTAQGAAQGGLFANLGQTAAGIPNLLGQNRGLTSGNISIQDLLGI